MPRRRPSSLLMLSLTALLATAAPSGARSPSLLPDAGDGSQAPGPAPICGHGTQAPIAPTAAADGSPDPAGRIVFGRLSRVDDIRDQLVALYAIDPDGTDLVPLLDCEVARPRFSADGSRLALGIAMDDGTMQVATMPSTGAISAS
jgi:hypothetical protein